LEASTRFGEVSIKCEKDDGEFLQLSVSLIYRSTVR